jgi:putative endonuclease
MRPAFVYLLRCSDGSIYTGWAYNVAQRLLVHQQGHGARYTRSRRPVKLLYSEQLPSRREAMLREIALKRWTRTRKLALAKTRIPARDTKSTRNTKDARRMKNAKDSKGAKQNTNARAQLH